MRLKDMDALAYVGANMPQGLTQTEQLYFLSVRMIYKQYTNGHIDEKQAKREKSLSEKAFADYEKLNGMGDLLRQENIDRMLATERLRSCLREKIKADEDILPILLELVEIYSGEKFEVKYVG